MTEHDNIMNTHIYKPPRVKESMRHAETLMINAMGHAETLMINIYLIISIAFIKE